MQLLTSSPWADYELIDAGGFEKLERFGKYTLWRPEPQAVWRKKLPEDEWERMHHARFFRDKEEKAADKGRWILKSGMPEQWYITYEYKKISFRLRLGLTAFKHIGVFPEQNSNWDYIYDSVTSLETSRCKVLNLFAYTGGASLVANAAGAEVVHVDSVKPVITWARENMEASSLDGIRWVVEDALKFVRREMKRGSAYDGIILDPPAYGRGPQGEKWVLEENIAEMMSLCCQLLKLQESFLVLNLYSMGFSAVVANNLVMDYFGTQPQLEFGELTVSSREGRMLPLGVFTRFRR
ncbi:MAG: class I SAM-dependent methyltransferase [Bacteroidales bacterium]|nr:class I SAM-dependent methyltransferase [Bacteroidales bacterium]MDZ4204922.1 class I SAM-dependent methyltransferase [Bacteroidales bacterium]